MFGSLLQHSSVKSALFWQVMTQWNYITPGYNTDSLIKASPSVFAAELQRWLQLCKQKLFIRAGIISINDSVTEPYKCVDRSVIWRLLCLCFTLSPFSRTRRCTWISFCCSQEQHPMRRLLGCVRTHGSCLRRCSCSCFKLLYLHFYFRLFLRFSSTASV